MDIFPSNAEGTLVNLLVSGMGPSSPERDLIGKILEKCLCIQSTNVEVACAGYITRDPGLFQDVLTVLPQFLTIDVPVWIEYPSASLEGFWGQPELPEDVWDMITGHCFFSPEDRPDVVGVITATSKGFTTNHDGHSETKGGVSVLPYVTYIRKNILAEAVQSIIGRPIDRTRGHLHRIRKNDTMEGCMQFFLDTTYVSEITGLIIDASIINEWNDNDKDVYARQSVQAALQATATACCIFVATQTKDISKGMPGHFVFSKEGGDTVLAWQRDRGMFATKQKPWERIVRILSPSETHQITGITPSS